MKEKIQEFLKKYEENKTEIVLMGIFAAAGLAFGISDYVQKTSSDRVQSVMEYVSEMESGAAGESEAEAESAEADDELTKDEAGTEDESGEDESGTDGETDAETRIRLEQSLASKLAVRGEGFCIPMLWEDPVSELYVGTSYAQWKLLRTFELYRQKYHWEDYQNLSEIGGPLEVLAQRPFSDLEELIEAKVAEYDGEWSVYVKKLSTNESFVINDVPMKSASVMKLFIMGTVYKAFESGELERTDEVMALMQNMIEYSDNEDSNRLLYLLGNGSYERGIAKVDAFIREYGFSDMTVEYNGFNDPATNMGSGMYNQVSAKDCGKLLEDIYRRTWVNRAVSNEMEAMLLAQNTRYKIPAGLPEGVFCGNKTGEMDTTENDAAIIYTDRGDYILVVLSSDWSSKDTAIERIRSISSAVYEFF